MLRTTLAVVFGFMSLLHAPIMAAAGQSAPAHHARHAVAPDTQAPVQHGHFHSHHDFGDEQPPLPAAGSAPSCFGVGCFVVLETLAVPASTVDAVAIARLEPLPGVAMLSSAPDPLVPPPRIFV
jgi:hypothetical protein